MSSRVYQKPSRAADTVPTASQQRPRVPVSARSDAVVLEREHDLREGIFAALQRAEEGVHDKDPRAPLGVNESIGEQGLPLQRKTGFEVELDVPAYATPAAGMRPVLTGEALTGEQTLAVQSFLAGGLKYGYKYGMDEDGLYHVTADHNAFSRKHSDLITSLASSHKIEPTFVPAMTNLEYVTAPFDEASANAIDEVGVTITNHAVDTAGKAQSGQQQAVAAPARDLITGVPVDALRALVGDDAVLNGKIDALNTAVTGSAYFQQSSGLLPSEIPGAFEAATAEIYDTGVFEIALDREGITKAQFDQLGPQEKLRVKGLAGRADVMRENPQAYAKAGLLYAAVQAAEAVAYGEAEAPAIAQVKGFLTLCAQYYMGSLLEGYARFTGGTEKNKVSFLSRVKLHAARASLSDPALQLLAAVWVPDEKAKFYARADHLGAAIIRLAGFVNADPTKRDILGADPKASLDLIMAGTEAATILPGSQLDVEALEDDELVDPGQKLIPMEDRDLGKKLPKADKATAQIGRVISERWDKMFQLRQGSRSQAAKDLIENYRELGLTKLTVLISAAEYQLSPEQVEELREKMRALQPILLDPGVLDETKVAEMVGAFPDIGDLRASFADIELAQQKKRVADYIYGKVRTDVRAKVVEKRAVEDSDLRRTERHASFEYTLASGVKGQVTGRNSFTPDIIEHTGEYFVKMTDGLALLSNVGGFAAYISDARRFLFRYNAGASQRLRFDSLAGPYVWA